MFTKSVAIILKTKKYLETSKLIYAYTKNFGKMTFLAKGVSSIKSRLLGSSEIFNIIEINYIKKENNSLHNIRDIEVTKSLSKISKSLEKSSIALLILESIFMTQDYENEDELFFDEIEKLLLQLNDNEEYFPIFVKSQLELAKSLGIEIELKWKSKSERDYELKKVFIRLSDCVISNTFDSLKKDYTKISMKSLLFLKDIKVSSLKELIEINMSENDFDILLRFFEQYFSYHLEKKIKYESHKLMK